MKMYRNEKKKKTTQGLQKMISFTELYAIFFF